MKHHYTSSGEKKPHLIQSLPEEDQVSLIPITALIWFLGSHPRDPTYQDASCHCPLTLDDHICSPIYRLSTEWPETVYTDYNVHTTCQWEYLPGASLFPIINTPSKELWYTFKKTYPLALVNCYNYSCCSHMTISIVWGCNQGGIVAGSMKQLSKSGEMFVTDNKAASISWPFCFSLIYNSSNSKISRASAFSFHQQLI